jgi:branched-chain amino acid transport system permease protein
MPTELANLIVGAVVLGCIYALTGVGFVLLYRATGVVSFAQGSFMLLGALLFYTLTQDAHWSLYPSMVVVVVLLAVIGFLAFQAVFGRVAAAEPFQISVATIALSAVATAAIQLIWGSGDRQLPRLISFATIKLPGNLAVTRVTILTLALAVVICGALVVTLRTTRLGLQMRAVADTAVVATTLGVNVRRIAAISWALAAAAAAVAGVVYSLGTDVSPSSIPDLGLMVFPAVLLGGLDSIGGALLGGIILALAQSAAVTVFGAAWSEITGYALLMVVLVVLPSGIFGRREAIRL